RAPGVDLPWRRGKPVYRVRAGRPGRVRTRGGVGESRAGAVRAAGDRRGPPARYLSRDDDGGAGRAANLGRWFGPQHVSADRPGSDGGSGGGVVGRVRRGGG